MARFARRMAAMHPVNRIKHVVDQSATLAAGVTLTQNLIVTVDAPVLANSNQVETASKVNGIYLKVEVAAGEVLQVGAIPNVYLTVSKNPAGALTALAPNAVGISNEKKYVIHQEMILINQGDGGNPRVLFNGVIVIPKGYKRNGPGDKLQYSILCPQVDIAVCAQAHYKEFR